MSRFLCTSFVRLVLGYVVVWTMLLAAVGQAQWDAPPSYYSGVTGIGATLKNSLRTTMSSGHILRNYGSFRYSSAIVDQDPNNASRILLVYNRASVPSVWDAGSTWNREHLWPQSRQPGEASNSTTGALADPFALRPANPGINSSRSNKPFGFDATTGSYGSQGSYYFPGDADKGDVARSLFYMDTRWSGSGLSLTDSFPSGNQMGDLSSLIAWHYLDVPDEFERRRNHTIYSSSYNPSYYTNNRNAYIDHPEFLWSIYMNQENNSQITIGGGTSGGNGASSLDLGTSSVIVGAAIPAPQAVTLNKGGTDGTYYSVTESGDATSSVEGRYNAFRTAATDSAIIQVGLDGVTATAGPLSGTVTIDNLDITDQGGAGVGANDADDTITVGLNVLDHAIPSFTGTSTLSTLTYDFGSVSLGSLATAELDLFNLVDTAGYTAGLNLYSLIGSGDTSILTTNLAPFAGLSAGASTSFDINFDTSTIGEFSASYTLSFSDEDLPGAIALSDLTLNLAGVVDDGGLAGDFDMDEDIDAADIDLLAANQGSVPPIDPKFDLNSDDTADFVTNGNKDNPLLISDSDEWIRGIVGSEYGDLNLDGAVNALDLSTLVGKLGTTGGWADGNVSGDSAVNSIDLSLLVSNLGYTNGGGSSTNVPEPSTIALMLLAAATSAMAINRRSR
jgi:endonuclease I